MKSSIGIGFLSFAHGHAALYANLMKEFDDARLVAAYDDDSSRGQAVCEPIALKYSPHIEDVLDNPDVHAVVVGSETNRHAELCVAAARAGKHILCQKPMALSLEDCDRIIREVDTAGVQFAMAFQMRHDPANICIREIVQSGVLGKIAVVRRRHCIGVLLMESFVTGPTKWHIDPIKNMGMFMDDAAHPADFLHWVFGKPTSVIAEIDSIITDVAPDDNGIAVFRFPDGMIGEIMNSSTVLAAENTTEIYGGRGCLIQNYGDGPSCSAPRCPDGPALKMMIYGESAWRTFDIAIPKDQGERIRAVPRPWLDSLLNETAPPASALDGRVAVEMILGAYQSARKGRRIYFDR